MTHPKDIVIVSAVRTPIGAFQGAFASLSAPKLGAIAIKAALERAGIKPDQIDEVYMGCVLQAGQGQAPARQAAIFAGLSEKTPATTVNKVCGSGLKTVMMAAQAIANGDAEVVVAGGMESMSNTPYLLGKARTGYRMGHDQIIDSMIQDGLWDVYNNFHMGTAAEKCAVIEGISRADQDAFAIESTRRAIAAQTAGAFQKEIVSVEIASKTGTILISEDEGPKNAKPEKIPQLKPVFQKDGTITAANASSINDGAAAVIVTTRARATQENWPILATITGQASAARAPVEFTIAPTDAVNKLLSKLSLKTTDIDLYEINEAFAVVSIANNRKLGLDPEKVNVRGGAVCLGHPLGASGTRVLVTLIHALKDLGKKRGIASLCIGGGEGVALGIEV